MQFPNAAKGIKKLWVAEILSIIAVVLTIAMAFVLVNNFRTEISAIEQAAKTGTDVVLSDAKLTDAQNNALLATGGLAIAMGIVGLIALIMGLVGTFQAKKDEVNFSYAFAVVIIGVLLSIVASALGTKSDFYKYAQLLSDVCLAAMNYYVLLGVAALALKKGENELHDSAKRASMLVSVSIIASEIIQLYANSIMKANQTLMIVLMSVTGVIEIVAYVYYLLVLSKARKMLEK